ncbi:MAG: hypothetical protein LIP09_05355 [Bacteroidales bacterium]|nr:hypothetical protein [Bacteroidales bacterium]
MNVTFKDPDLKTIYDEGTISHGRYKIFCRNVKLVQGFIRAVDLMIDATSTEDLKIFSYLHYEKLKHEEKSSIRVLNGYVHRLLFTENEHGIEVELLEIDDKHYGKKR